MPLLQLFIINRNGGLVYNKLLNNLAPTKSVNDMMVLGSTFHSLYEIIKQIAPVVSSEGIEVIETAAFKLHCFQTRTGVKFVVTATPDTRSDELITLCQYVYSLYSDYALKSPFYEMEQPINCHLFSSEVNRAVQSKVYLQQKEMMQNSRS